MPIIFVAGTDTGVGKTLVTGLLNEYISGLGYTVAAQKWVETGMTGKSAAVYSFKFAASPHLAARLEGRKINAYKIRIELKKSALTHEFVIVEGTGGLLVPISADELLIDLAAKLKLPVVLVSANRIGAINHALLSLEALRIRKMNIAGVIFNSTAKNVNGIITKDNPHTVKQFSGCEILGVLPYSKNARALKRDFVKIGAKIMKCL